MSRPTPRQSFEALRVHMARMIALDGTLQSETAHDYGRLQQMFTEEARAAMQAYIELETYPGLIIEVIDLSLAPYPAPPQVRP